MGIGAQASCTPRVTATCTRAFCRSRRDEKPLGLRLGLLNEAASFVGCRPTCTRTRVSTQEVFSSKAIRLSPARTSLLFSACQHYHRLTTAAITTILPFHNQPLTLPPLRHVPHRCRVARRKISTAPSPHSRRLSGVQSTIEYSRNSGRKNCSHKTGKTENTTKLNPRAKVPMSSTETIEILTLPQFRQLVRTAPRSCLQKDG